jgi:hypothetical protein
LHPIALDAWQLARQLRAQNTVEFTLAFNGGATGCDVTWSMKGKVPFMLR